MKKKIVSIFLSLVLIFVAIPFSSINVISYDIPDCPNCGGDTYQGLQTYPCTTGGYATFICTICEYSFEMEVDPKEHNYEVIDCLDATCDEDGYIEYCCHDCNDSYTENLPATGHSLGMEQTIYSCTSGGYVYATCSTCQMDIVLRTIPAYGHSYNETVIRNATCYSMGISEFWCSGCDHSYTETTPKSPHIMDRWHYENPTCTERGYKIRYCMNVGMCDYFEDALIPATGHSFGDWVITDLPSDSISGTKQHSCTTCNHTETIAIEPGEYALGDTSGDGIVDENDYNSIVEMANGTKTPTDSELSAADINQDGTVDGFDAIYFDLLVNEYI